MLCLSDHQTIAFEDQSTIPKATFIETGINRGNPARKIDQCIKRYALSKEIDKRRDSACRVIKMLRKPKDDPQVVKF